MTELLKQAVEAVRRLPADDQEDIARVMLRLAASGESPEDIEPGHLRDVLDGLTQARSGEFASDAEVEAAFRRFGA